MITYVPGKGPVDDSIPAGQPGGPLPIVPPNTTLPGATDPDAATIVPFSDTLPGTGTAPTDPTLTPA